MSMISHESEVKMLCVNLWNISHWMTTTHTGWYGIAQNFGGGNFDVYWLFKYLMENILTDGHRLSPCLCKYFNAFINGWVKFWQSSQNFPCQNFALHGNYWGVVITQWYWHCSYHLALSFDVWLHWNRI